MQTRYSRDGQDFKGWTRFSQNVKQNGYWCLQEGYRKKCVRVVDLGSEELENLDQHVVLEFTGVDIRQDRVTGGHTAPALCVANTSHPGYVLLHNNLDQCYLNPSCLKVKAMQLLGQSCFPLFERVYPAHPVTEGPALHGLYRDEFGVHMLTFVPCLLMKEWPYAADFFLRRHRPSGRPSPDLVREVSTVDCGLVPTGYKGSGTETLEWKLIFPVAEKILVRNLTVEQMRSYLFLKSLYKLHLTMPACLSPYMLKTVLLWGVEQMPADIWQPSNVFQCVEELLRQLAQYVEKGFLPHYFVEKRNLLPAASSKAAFSLLQRKVLNIQEKLLATIVQCADSPTFLGLHDTSLTSLKVKMDTEPERDCHELLCVLYYLMYLNIRLQALQYKCTLGLHTLQECMETCRSLAQAVPPRAAWYLVQALKVLPDQSWVQLHCSNGQLVLEMSGIRRAAAKFVLTDEYEGQLKRVLKDQEYFIFEDSVKEIPEFDTLVEWVDMMSMWNGGQPLSGRNMDAPETSLC